ncbi:HPr family phosphocarrier protein [Haloglycomyces albus]|uniref:HPr family phosphocarrier protein n=1 Tax=Haloglycomyces albus TaxID=526067 RepID=UPI00046CFD2F|nr:HPr family phosphocarrier protein [Haloglycomyces albus]
MPERRVTVTTEVGIQARPATNFVDTAAESSAPIYLAKGSGEPVEAKSILQVLVLDVRQGDEVVITGDDEKTLDKLVALVTGEQGDDTASATDDTSRSRDLGDDERD